MILPGTADERIALISVYKQNGLTFDQVLTMVSNGISTAAKAQHATTDDVEAAVRAWGDAMTTVYPGQNIATWNPR